MFRKGESRESEVGPDPELNKYISENDEDPDSRAERTNVERFGDDLREYPLVCNNLRKLYKKEGRDEPYGTYLLIQPLTKAST